MYCLQCDKVYAGWNKTDHSNHATNEENLSNCFHLPGVYVVPDFLTFDEEQIIVDSIDSGPWEHSQSGRRKQVVHYFLFLIHITLIRSYLL